MTPEQAILAEFEGTADAHLRPHGATVQITLDRGWVTLSVTKGDLSLKESVNVGGMPAHIQLEYAHCCGHNLAALLLQALYPT